MSLGVVFKGPEGIVLAADSRVTLTYQSPGANPSSGAAVMAEAYFDNATKLLKIDGQDHVATITVGLGAIGMKKPRTANSFLPEFENDLGRTPGRLSVLEFSSKLGQFFLEQWQASMSAEPPSQEMVFITAGYDENEPYGKVYRLSIPSSPTPKELKPDDFGLYWEGQSDITTRILNGLDFGIVSSISKKFNLDASQTTSLIQEIKAVSTLPIPYQFLSLQDGVDLCIILVQITEQLMKFTTGVRGVGGEIDAATITRTGGFKFVQHKLVHGEKDRM